MCAALLPSFLLSSAVLGTSVRTTCSGLASEMPDRFIPASCRVAIKLRKAINHLRQCEETDFADEWTRTMDCASSEFVSTSTSERVVSWNRNWQSTAQAKFYKFVQTNCKCELASQQFCVNGIAFSSVAVIARVIRLHGEWSGVKHPLFLSKLEIARETIAQSYTYRNWYRFQNGISSGQRCSDCLSRIEHYNSIT